MGNKTKQTGKTEVYPFWCMEDIKNIFHTTITTDYPELNRRSGKGRQQETGYKENLFHVV